MENIGDKIMQARKTKGMTQDTLAQLVNVSRQTVSHWENGRAMPDVATAAQLSKVLDVNFLADEAAEDTAVQPPEAVPTVQEPVQETQEQTDGRFVNPPEQPKQPSQRKRIAVICAAVVIIVAAVGRHCAADAAQGAGANRTVLSAGKCVHDERRRRVCRLDDSLLQHECQRRAVHADLCAGKMVCG